MLILFDIPNIKSKFCSGVNTTSSALSILKFIVKVPAGFDKQDWLYKVVVDPLLLIYKVISSCNKPVIVFPIRVIII